MIERAEKEWENIFQAIGNPTLILDKEHNILRANRAAVEAIGVATENDLIGRKCYEIFHNTSEPPEGCPLQKALITGSFEENDMEVEALGRIFHVYCSPVFNGLDEKGSLQKIIHIATDVSKIKETEKNLLLQQKLLTAINQGQQNFITEQDKNSAFESLLSDILEITNSEYGFIGEVLYTKEGQPYLKIYAITNISWDEKTLKLYNKYAQKGMEFYNLKTLFGYTLSTGQAVISNDPLNDPRKGGLPNGHPPLKAYLGIPIMQAGNMVAMVGIANRPGGYNQEQIDLLQPLMNTIGQLIEARRTLEDQNRAEAEIIDSRQRLTKVLDSINAIVCVIDMETYEVLYINKQLQDIVGDVVGKTCWKVLQAGQSGPCPFCTNAKLLNPDGKPKDVYVWEHQNTINNRWYEFRDLAIYWIDGRLVKLEIATDISERKNFEKALRESEESYRRLFEDHSAVKFIIDPDTGNIVDANKAAANFYGWSREELKQMKIHQINTLSPEKIKEEIEKIRTLKKTYFEFRHRIADGSIKDVRVFSSKVKIKEKDYLHSIIHDVTKEKELEAQLLQSQKLESIGRLAGGIAHDFNNMLNVILGYGDIILNKLNQKDPLYKEITEIVEAGRRSKALTQQLLAFSRKQILQTKVFNINETLTSMQKMLERLIGEDIELLIALGEDIHNIEVDPSQIEQVIINLVVNARDAMPFGGKLIIETSNVFLDEKYAESYTSVIPGEYVMITITDTGAGIDKDTLSHIFEPFFTTKEGGTGLGLSTVYGIVKQSNGHIWVYSEVDKGTTFKIYIPAAFKEPQVEPEEERPEKTTLKGVGEHILVVEDEPSLQGLFEVFLTTLGYKTTITSNGGEALLLIEEKGLKPDLIITDVVMPIMSGAELVKRLKKSQPNLKVLYMSGYTPNAIVHHGVLEPGTPFIQKPFNMNELALKIEQLLRK